MAIIVPCRPNGPLHPQDTITETMESCLSDMAKRVIIHLAINFSFKFHGYVALSTNFAYIFILKNAKTSTNFSYKNFRN